MNAQIEGVVEIMCAKVCGVSEPFSCVMEKDTELQERLFDSFNYTCPEQSELYLEVVEARVKLSQAPKISFVALNPAAKCV